MCPKFRDSPAHDPCLSCTAPLLDSCSQAPPVLARVFTYEGTAHSLPRWEGRVFYFPRQGCACPRHALGEGKVLNVY